MEFGHDINEIDQNGQTALHHAARNGHLGNIKGAILGLIKAKRNNVNVT